MWKSEVWKQLIKEKRKERYDDGGHPRSAATIKSSKFQLQTNKLTQPEPVLWTVAYYHISTTFDIRHFANMNNIQMRNPDSIEWYYCIKCVKKSQMKRKFNFITLKTGAFYKNIRYLQQCQLRFLCKMVLFSSITATRQKKPCWKCSGLIILNDSKSTNINWMIAHSETLQFTWKYWSESHGHIKCSRFGGLLHTILAVCIVHFLGAQSNREIIFQMGHCRRIRSLSNWKNIGNCAEENFDEEKWKMPLSIDFHFNFFLFRRQNYSYFPWIKLQCQMNGSDTERKNRRSSSTRNYEKRLTSEIMAICIDKHRQRAREKSNGKWVKLELFIIQIRT